MSDKKKKAFRTNVHAIFSTDKTREEDGAWVEVNGFYGLKIKIRRFKSDASSKVYERIVRETFGEGKLRKPSDMTTEQSTDMLKAQLAEGVLIDWVNLRDADTGEEVPYSVEMSRTLMDIPDFRDFVYQASNERDSFRELADKEAEGNSSGS